MIRPLVLCLLWSSAAAFGLAGGDKAAKMDTLVKAYHGYQMFNGSVLVAYQGEVVFKAGYGLADMEWDVPNAPDTRFRIGSVTKQFTAVAILKLVDDGVLKLDATVSSILPDYPKETGDKITVHQLLNHTSGIPNYTTREFFAKYSTLAKTPTEFWDYFKDLPLDFEPGTAYRYSNSAYFLLGSIIEKLSGKPYDVFLRERILDPLGLKDTGYDHSDAILPRRARGYERGPEGYRNAAYLHMSLPFSAGSMYSTVEDLYRWDRALVAGKVLPEALMKKMYTPGLENYGYGWVLPKRDLPGHDEKVTMIEHGGSINGFNALITRYPEEGLVVVALNNTGGAPLGNIARDLIGILYGEDVPLPKKPAFMDLVAKIDDPAFPALCKQLLADVDDYDIEEASFNALGYRLMNTGKLDVAQTVFTINTAAHPKSPNVWDSLGECLAAQGRKAEAIANYEKVLVLDPGNQNATDMLKKIKGE